MDRHDLDPIALVFGATFTLLGLAYAISRWSWIGVDSGWLLGAFLITLGIAGIVSVTVRQRRESLGTASGAAVDASVRDDPSATT